MDKLKYLFDHPKEPLFVPRGDENITFNVPNEYLSDRYQQISTEITDRFGATGSQMFSIKKIKLPDISQAYRINRNENFSVFLRKHQKIASNLINILMGMKDIDDLLSAAVSCRDKINPYLFNYCLSVAVLHRKDTRNFQLPNFIETFPDKFFNSSIFSSVHEEISLVPEGSRVPIIIPRNFTASDAEIENRLAYFREDIGLNLHHWHWHLVYPFEADRAIVAKDRRGELFYYMHQQIIARYNFERLCNHLDKVERFYDYKKPIREAYFPKLDSTVASRNWPFRVADSVLRNLNRTADEIIQDVNDLQIWYNKIHEVIQSKRYITESGDIRTLDETTGIDVLGNMIESSILSPNRQLYGNLHNMGHIFISYIHDPEHKYLESFGVMGDSATAMRDPIFYRWHSSIDDLFQKYKQTLNAYTERELNFQNVIITNVEVKTANSKNKNQFETFWEESDVNLSRGLDFVPHSPIFARFTHLQNRPFEYNIQINNQSEDNAIGICRIFLSPKLNIRKAQMSFSEQRLMMIELDRFRIQLKNGMNSIKRKSNESSVTIPYERTFRNLADTQSTNSSDLNFCSCGWPQHLLIPKGNEQGFSCELFVMISNDDFIKQDSNSSCDDSFSFCGLKDRLYPDRRAMGFPFDRNTRNDITVLDEFLTKNMRKIDVTIKHFNIVQPHKKQ